MLLLIYSARKRSDCVFDVLFARSVDPFPFRLCSFKNHLCRCCVFYPACRFIFLRGDSFCFNQEPLALLNGGMP